MPCLTQLFIQLFIHDKKKLNYLLYSITKILRQIHCSLNQQKSEYDFRIKSNQIHFSN